MDEDYQWFTEYAGNKLGRLSIGGVFTEYPIPTAASRPERIKTSADGSLWFVENASGKLVEASTAGVMTEMAVPTTSGGLAGVAVARDLSVWFTENSANQVGKNVSPLYGVQPLNDPFAAVKVPVGLDAVRLNAGDLQAQIPLSYQGTQGTQDQHLWAGLASQDALIYNSDRVSVRPVVQATFATDVNGTVPTSLAAQLTWNGGSPQATVTYQTTGHAAGDIYLVGGEGGCRRSVGVG